MPSRPRADRPAHLLAIAAKTPESLGELVDRYVESLGSEDAPPLPDACFTAGTGRTHFAERVAVVASTVADARQKLVTARGTLAQRPRASVERRPRVALLFTGQGAQYVGMGRALYESQPVFRAAFDRCAARLDGQLPRPLTSVVFAADEQLGALVDETGFSQPALFALEYGLAELWRSWGIEPDVVMGHSVGEYVAACVAGVFSLEDGLDLIAARARLMQELPAGGGMAAVFAAEAAVRRSCSAEPAVSIAAVNGPEHVVLSGPVDAIERLVAELGAAGIRARRLTVSHGFHSALLEPMLDRFEAAARRHTFSAARVPLVSNLTGRFFGVSEVPDAAYWRRHAREAVRFADGVRAVAERGITAALEIGPAPILVGMAAPCVPDRQIAWLPSLRRGRPDWQQMLESLAVLYQAGARVEFAEVDRGYQRHRVTLPASPLQRQRFWISSTRRAADAAPAVHPLLGHRVVTASDEKIYETHISVGEHPYLADHCVHGSVVVPATAYLEMAVAAATDGLDGSASDAVVLEDVVIHRALALADDERLTVQLVLSPGQDGSASFKISSAPPDAAADTAWTLHAAGRARLEPAGTGAPNLPPFDAAEGQEMPAAGLYDGFRARDIAFGPAFRGVERLQRCAADVVARVDSSVSGGVRGYRLHPALLDACLHPIGACLPGAATDTYLPLSFDSVRVFGTPAAHVYSRASIRPSAAADTGRLVADVTLAHDTGAVIAEVRGLQLQRVSPEVLERATRSRAARDFAELLYDVQWVERSLAPRAMARTDRGSWIVLADRTGVAAELATRLRARGEECVLVVRRPTMRAAARWRLDDLASRPQRPRPRAGDAGRRRAPPAARGRAPVEPRRAVHVRGSGRFGADLPGALQLMRGVARLAQREPPAVWFVTRGTQSVNGESVGHPEAAALWGMGRIGELEHPEMRCTRVDLDPGAVGGADALLRELDGEPDEREIAWRRSGRYAARLVRHKRARRPGASALAGSPSAWTSMNAGRSTICTPRC